MYALIDFWVLHCGSGGQPDDLISIDAVGLLSYAVGRNCVDGGSGGGAIRRENPFYQQKHLRVDPGGGDGGARQRRLPHGAVFHHHPGGYRALHRAQ